MRLGGFYEISDSVFVLLMLVLPGFTFAQGDLVAAVTGNVTGLVENNNGDMVPPQAAVQATVVVNDDNGVVVANVSGTASCTGGLGLHFAFEAQYNTDDNSFVGMYSDIPGSAPDKALAFANDGGYSWTALLSGTAASDSGPRAYDLSFNFDVPETAVFSGNALPADLVYAGSLVTTQVVSVPLVISEVGINQNLEFSVDFSGNWSATAVPLEDGSSVFTGQASGSFASSNTVTVDATIPLQGALSIPVTIGGSFGGSLFLIDEDTVSFQGSWVGSGADQTFGGDINIDIELQDTSSFPFSVSGTIPIEIGVDQLPTVEIPFAVSGLFPLSIQ